MQVDVGYPDREAENLMLMRTTVGDEKPLQPVLNPEILIKAQALSAGCPSARRSCKRSWASCARDGPTIPRAKPCAICRLGSEPARQPQRSCSPSARVR